MKQATRARLAVDIGGTFTDVVLERAERLAAEAERMSVEMQIEALNRLATLRYASLLSRGGPQSLSQLEGANPMLWDVLVSPNPLAGGAGEATTGPVAEAFCSGTLAAAVPRRRKSNTIPSLLLSLSAETRLIRRKNNLT